LIGLFFPYAGFLKKYQGKKRVEKVVQFVCEGERERRKPMDRKMVANVWG